jgi:GNAT superfamily N-acetyltransferase
MSSIEVRPVSTPRERHRFLTFPWHVYRNDPLWVPPLLPELKKRIDPRQSPFLQRGEAEFFIAWRDGKLVGTICAAQDRTTNHLRGEQTCVFGFFEYVADWDVFTALLEQAISWGRQRNLTELFGPFDLDYEDSYGVLLEGRDRPPALMCGHSPPYYCEFMDRFGFQPSRGDNLAYAVYPDMPGFERLSRVADKVRKQGSIKIRGADFDRWDEEIDRVVALLNDCLAHLPDHLGWQRESLASLVAPFRRIADPELILFAEVKDEPVGWLPGIPNLNEVFIQVNGLRRSWDYVKLWWLMRQQTESLTIKSILVRPEYWNTGVAVLLLDEMARRARPMGYKWADLSLTSADNPSTPLLAGKMGAKLYKRYRVYRYSI